MNQPHTKCSAPSLKYLLPRQCLASLKTRNLFIDTKTNPVTGNGTRDFSVTFFFKSFQHLCCGCCTHCNRVAFGQSWWYFFSCGWDFKNFVTEVCSHEVIIIGGIVKWRLFTSREDLFNNNRKSSHINFRSNIIRNRKICLFRFDMCLVQRGFKFSVDLTGGKWHQA